MKSHFTDFHQTRKEHTLAVSVELAQQAQKSSVMKGRDHITPLRLVSLADNNNTNDNFILLVLVFCMSSVRKQLLSLCISTHRLNHLSIGWKGAACSVR